MQLVPRPSDVRGLLQEPAYARRILDRVQGVLGFGEEEDFDTIDVLTSGLLPAKALEQIYVVRIRDGESIVAKVHAARVGDHSCRLLLGGWKVFINADQDLPQLEPGVHLWLGAAWKTIPTSTVH